MKFGADKQALFLMLLEGGALRSEAARRCNVSTATVRSALKMGLDSEGNPLPDTFAEKVAEIEETERELAESILYKAVKNGEPWAVQMWLKGKYREMWADKPGPLVAINNQTLNIQGTPDEQRRAIEALATELDARMEIAPGLAQEVLDAEEIE